MSRYLKIDAVEADGRPVDLIQNQALEGTELGRKGNDLVALVALLILHQVLIRVARLANRKKAAAGV